MLLALILKMPDHFGKNKSSRSILKKIKIQKQTNHANNLFIHEIEQKFLL